MNGKHVFAVGKVCPDVGIVTVTEQDALGTLSWPEFLEGYNGAIRGADLSEMQTADSVAGWHYARRCAGSKHNEDDGSVEDDYEDIRRGF